MEFGITLSTQPIIIILTITGLPESARYCDQAAALFERWYERYLNLANFRFSVLI